MRKILNALVPALLLAAWAAYPLTIAAVGALKRRQTGAESLQLPYVSVIVATREAADSIRERVEDCLRADYPAEFLEVIVALDVSVDAERRSDVDCGERATVVKGDVPGGKAAALNAGVRASRGEVLVFADTHQRFSEGPVREKSRRRRRDGPQGAGLTGEGFAPPKLVVRLPTKSTL